MKMPDASTVQMNCADWIAATEEVMTGIQAQTKEVGVRTLA
jgi:hypothetical protein